MGTRNLFDEFNKKKFNFLIEIIIVLNIQFYQFINIYKLIELYISFDMSFRVAAIITLLL